MGEMEHKTLQRISNWAPVAATVLLLLWLWTYPKFGMSHPPVGFYIAVLAFLAAVVSIMPPNNHWARAAWFIFFGAVLTFEITTLYQQRREDEAAANINRQREDEQVAMTRRLEDIRLAAILHQNRVALGEMLNTETGGDSFCYLYLSPAQTGWIMELEKVGKYPLHSVEMQLTDNNVFQSEMARLHPDIQSHRLSALNAMEQAQTRSEQSITVGDFNEPSRRLLGGHPYPNSGQQEFSLFVGSLNGSWIEQITLRNIDGKWLEAVYVEGNAGGRPIDWNRIDKGFPLIDGNVPGWPVPNPGSGHARKP